MIANYFSSFIDPVYFSIINIGIIILALMIATITDIYKQEIPIYLFPIACIICTLFTIPKLENFIGALILGITFLLFAVFGNNGGGDVIMMAVVGYQLGIRKALWCALIAYLLYAIYAVIYYLIKKNKHKSFPFAPFALIGYLSTLFI